MRITKSEVCVRVFETAMTTPQTKDLIGWMRKSNHPVMLFGAIFYARLSHEIYLLMITMQAHSIKFFILCPYMKTIHAKQVKVHFAHLYSILIWCFCCSSHHSFLNSLTCQSRMLRQITHTKSFMILTIMWKPNSVMIFFYSAHP